tara:strand:- start:2686 stop:3249 length:564 start_codon:yes stop_codon:yes gene_type:complete
MPRASSILPQVNIDGNQMVNISNTSLDVYDSGANTLLSSLDTKIINCDTSNLSTSANQLSANASLSSIDSKLTTPLSIVQSVAISGSHGNMSNASVVVANDFSTAIDISGFSKNSLSIESTTSDQVEIWISGDSGTNYILHGSIWLNSPFSGANYYGYLKLENDVITHIKIKYTSSSTVTSSCFSRV